MKALVLISPDSNAGRLATTRSLTFLNKQNLSFLFMAGKQDLIDKGAAKNCFKACGSDKKGDGRVVLVEPDLKDRGIDLFGKRPPEVEVPILKFLDERLKKITVPWVIDEVELIASLRLVVVSLWSSCRLAPHAVQPLLGASHLR